MVTISSNNQFNRYQSNSNDEDNNNSSADIYDFNKILSKKNHSELWCVYFELIWIKNPSISQRNQILEISKNFINNLNIREFKNSEYFRNFQFQTDGAIRT